MRCLMTRTADKPARLYDVDGAVIRYLQALNFTRSPRWASILPDDAIVVYVWLCVYVCQRNKPLTLATPLVAQFSFFASFE